MLHSIAVLEHPKRPETHALAGDIARMLTARGLRVTRSNSWDTGMMATFMPGIDLAIVLGGDGSILRAVRAAAPYGVPVASVHMGKLGFLSEMHPDNWRELLPAFIDGAFWVEDRSMLTATAMRGPQVVGIQDAVNDVVVGRRTMARIVRVRVSVDGAPITTYACDGMIVATATGSTAYALAAGGPILAPTLKNMLVVPIAAHLSLDRALLLHHTCVVELAVTTETEATMTADGQQEIVLSDGDVVTVKAHPNSARFARIQPRDYFYRTLVGRLLRPEAIAN